MLKYLSSLRGIFFMTCDDSFKEIDRNASLEEKIATIKYNIGWSANIRKQISAWGGGYTTSSSKYQYP